MTALQSQWRSITTSDIEDSCNNKCFNEASSVVGIIFPRTSEIAARIIRVFSSEFAFVEKASEFYTSTYPVVSAGKDTKVIITSTANGIGNMFYKIWEGAVQEVNEFNHFRVDWYDVPGRDEIWKQQTIFYSSFCKFTGVGITNLSDAIGKKKETGD